MMCVTCHNAVWMVAFVFFDLFPRAKTRRTYVHAVARLAFRVCTFDANRMGEVAGAAVAQNLETRLVYGRSKASKSVAAWEIQARVKRPCANNLERILTLNLLRLVLPRSVSDSHPSWPPSEPLLPC